MILGWHLTHSFQRTGGEGGIRTHVTISREHAFQACSFSHSDTSPRNVAVKYDDVPAKPAVELPSLPEMARFRHPLSPGNRRSPPRSPVRPEDCGLTPSATGLKVRRCFTYCESAGDTKPRR